ncbi:MAG: hypothetical protein D6677_08110 [Calditrichaeota bacterium]|nr:MAG: hypothetical protein D6677_08110 [Calditrichota bacterium]
MGIYFCSSVNLHSSAFKDALHIIYDKHAESVKRILAVSYFRRRSKRLLHNEKQIEFKFLVLKNKEYSKQGY